MTLWVYELYTAVLGFLVTGSSGAEDSSVDRRLGGENIIDRSVDRVSFDNGIDSGSYIGGLLGMDFGFY